MRSGGYVNPGTPLGMSDIASHTHYIRPVPPTYVTEYEANFTWPHIRFYDHNPDEVDISSRGDEKGGNWHHLTSAVQKMIQHDCSALHNGKFPEPKKLLSTLEQRRFDGNIEKALNIIKDEIKKKEKLEEEEKDQGDSLNIDKRSGRKKRAKPGSDTNIVKEISKEAMQAYHEYVLAVENIKNA